MKIGVAIDNRVQSQEFRSETIEESLAFLGGINGALGRKNESEAAYRRALDAAEGHLELFRELEHECFELPSDLAMWLRSFKTSQPDDDQCELYWILCELYQMGAKEPLLLACQPIGMNLQRTLADLEG